MEVTTLQPRPTELELRFEPERLGVGDILLRRGTVQGFAEMAYNYSTGSHEALRNFGAVRANESNPRCIEIIGSVKAKVGITSAAQASVTVLALPYYSTGLNPYDIRGNAGETLCYNFTDVDNFWTMNRLKEARCPRLFSEPCNFM